MVENKQELCPYYVGENIDCLDTVNKWLDAVVKEIDFQHEKVLVTYSGYGKRYDEWISYTADEKSRLQKQWRRGMPFALNNRLDILDNKNNWLEATVVDLTELIDESGKLHQTRIKVHFKGFKAAWDEEFDLTNPVDCAKISEVGSFSKAHGWAKTNQAFREQISQQQQPKIQKENPISDQQKEDLIQQFKARESQFRTDIEQNANLKVVETESDGNCLFRAIAYQLYGDQEVHEMVRVKCMQYILAAKDYFKAFISDETVEHYCERKMNLGIWGDDVELQAISEIYDRPIEIFAYSTQPMRTFHEQQDSENLKEPLRLSYHGQSHYNALVPQNFSRLIMEPPGAVEDFSIEIANKIKLENQPNQD